MKLDDGNFALIEKKIADIQDKIDRSLVNPGARGELAIGHLRGARGDLFSLREILRNCLEIEPTIPEPQGPRAA